MVDDLEVNMAPFIYKDSITKVKFSNSNHNAVLEIEFKFQEGVMPHGAGGDADQDEDTQYSRSTISPSQ